jgi:hypothetical protein
MKIKVTEEQLKKIVNYNITEQNDSNIVGDSFIQAMLDRVKKRIGGKFVKKDGDNSSDTSTNNGSDNSFGTISGDFKKMTELVINKLEGGYFNPQWHKSSGMGDSGETMFGIDRKHGGTLNTSNPGIEFWDLIDKNKDRRVWKRYYRGGNLEQRLIDLVVKIMEPHFNKLADKYLSPEAKNIVMKSNSLLFHFIYASWNGSGFFQKFANAINEEVAKGNTSVSELKKVAIQSRRNSAVSGSASKIENIMNSLS